MPDIVIIIPDNVPLPHGPYFESHLFACFILLFLNFIDI